MPLPKGADGMPGVIVPRKTVGEALRLIEDNAAEVVILCLPDDAAKEAVSLITNPTVKVIDASTAHRVAPGWAYGFPEMADGHRAAIRASKRRSCSSIPTSSQILIRVMPRVTT